MKKILVVLLILAVAGGVFAQQGDWNIGGRVEIGTRLNLDPQPDIDSKDDPATAQGWAYNDSYQQQRGTFNLGYSRDNAYVGVTLNGDKWNSGTDFNTTFWGDSFAAKFAFSDLLGIVNGGGNIDEHIGALWGEYKFVEGMITLKAAYKGGWEWGEWTSDNSAGWVEGSDYETGLGFGGGGMFTLSDNWFAFDYGYEIPKYPSWATYYMPGNYLRAKAELGNINFGIQIPYLFVFGDGVDAMAAGPAKVEFAKNSLKQSVFGVKFAQAPLEFAAQFALANYGVYFGGKFFTGPVTVGLSFMGILDGDGHEDGADADWQRIKLGGNVGYNGDGFGGGLLAFYQKEDAHQDGSAAYGSIVGIEPSFFYNAIPSYLQFKLNVGFYFFTDSDGGNSSKKATTWGLQPEIHWNFLGTGAGDWGASNTGIAIRYRMSNADLRDLGDLSGIYGGDIKSQNTLDFLFRWGF